MIPWGFILRIAAPLVLAIGLFGWGYSAGAAGKQRAWDLAAAAQVKAQLAATEQARTAERALQLKVSEVERARQTDRARSARVAADMRAESDSLRSDIARFASGGTDDSGRPATGRAEQLGQLLDAALQTAGECAIRGENDAAIARGLLAAWPVTP